MFRLIDKIIIAVTLRFRKLYKLYLKISTNESFNENDAANAQDGNFFRHRGCYTCVYIIDPCTYAVVLMNSYHLPVLRIEFITICTNKMDKINVNF